MAIISSVVVDVDQEHHEEGGTFNEVCLAVADQSNKGLGRLCQIPDTGEFLKQVARRLL